MATTKPKDAPAAAAATPAPVVAAAATEAVDAATGAALQEALSRAERAEEALADEKEAHAETTAERDSLEEELTEANLEIINLNQQLSKAQAAAGTTSGADRTVEHAGKTYRVVVPKFATIKGEFEAADVTTGSDVLAHLVKIKSGVLEEVDAD